MDLLRALEGIRVPFLDGVFSALTYLGSEITVLVVPFVLYWCISKRDGLYMMANVLFGAGVANGSKFIFRVPRPFALDPEFTIVESAREGAAGYSFPSGHSQSAVTMAAVLTVLYKKKKAVWITALALAALVCFSRMYLGVHYPTDVLGGIAAALLVLAVLHPLMKAADRKPVLLSVIFGVGAVLFLGLGLIFEFCAWGGEVDQNNRAEAVKVVHLIGGCMAGAALGAPLERKYVNFDVKAVWWAQILKVALGLGVLLGFRMGLKPVFAAVFGTLGFGDFLRYFVLALAGIFLWPMTFRFFGKLGKKA